MSIRRLYLCAGTCAVLIATSAAKCYGQGISASQIVSKYVDASGGESAIRAIRTRVMTGFVVAPGGRAQLEIIEAAPDHFLRIIESPVSGHSENGYDGTVAWSRTAAGIREMSGPPVGMVVREQHLHRPLALQAFYVSIDSPRLDSVDGAAVYVVGAKTADGMSETLYFDRTTGLLAGWDVAIGGTVLQTRLEDYRTVDGVKLPFRFMRSRPDFKWTEELTEVKHNVSVDPARFSKPSS